MVRQFAGQPPRALSVVTYAAGYAAGALVAFVSYLVSGVWKVGALALVLTQRKGIVPEARN